MVEMTKEIAETIVDGKNNVIMNILNKELK